MRLDARGPSEAVRSGHVGTGVRERDCPGVRPRRVGVPEMLCVRASALSRLLDSTLPNLTCSSIHSSLINSAKCVPDFRVGSGPPQPEWRK